MKMRVFTKLLGIILPTLIFGGRIVNFEGSQPIRHTHLSYNNNRIPVENFNGVVIKAHSLSNSGEIRKSPVKTYVENNYNNQNEFKQPVLTGVVGQAPHSIFTGVIGKVSPTNNLLQNPLNSLFTNGHNLLGTPNNAPLVHPLLPQPILRADQVPNNQPPPGYVYIPGPLRQNSFHSMPQTLMGSQTMFSLPIQFQQPSLPGNLQQSSLPTPGQLVTISPNILTNNNHFTPIPGLPTFPSFTMPPAFDKLVPEAREAKEKAERKYSPRKNYYSNMDIESLESRLPKYKERSSNKYRLENSNDKSQVWMVPYYNRK
ncbi:Hypothetical protein SRAE_X000177000 [Strongyloides ratti]|uniref:Uncharacterized protein n=1 Tax=Strongyloides ratti TaxID=34506 RepID=A0A090KRL5_STRRB|nr:Hypothetical protein SRAE_X000177000 [Strongyloides ratti]CEF60030.1 Hypothetical protein SRAE_X000177000 [Strongyloides ratti]